MWLLKLLCQSVKLFQLRVFLPFFVGLDLPFSVKRNEQLVIQANVFNYFDQDLYASTLYKNYIYTTTILLHIHMVLAYYKYES